jgi:hypothetical protein
MGRALLAACGGSTNPLRGSGPAGDGSLRRCVVANAEVIWWASRPDQSEGCEGLDPSPVTWRWATAGIGVRMAITPPSLIGLA